MSVVTGIRQYVWQLARNNRWVNSFFPNLPLRVAYFMEEEAKVNPEINFRRLVPPSENRAKLNFFAYDNVEHLNQSTFRYRAIFNAELKDVYLVQDAAYIMSKNTKTLYTESMITGALSHKYTSFIQSLQP